MGRFFSLFLALALFMGFGCERPVIQRVQDSFPSSSVLERSLRSTVLIMEGDEIKCAGVFVSSRHILTAGHCVEHIQILRTPFGILTARSQESPIGDYAEVIPFTVYRQTRMSRTIRFEVVAHDQDKDLALLRQVNPFDGYEARVVGMYPDRRLRIGTPLFTIGHPLQIAWNVTFGHVSSLRARGSGDSWYFFSNVEVFNGNSGGPMLDSQGRLCGIVSSIAGRQAHLNRSVHIDSIANFLSSYLVVAR